jgi:Na+(H+)/acetate symporter ActP
MTSLYIILFLLPFVFVPLICAWLYKRKNVFSHGQSYLINGIVTGILPFVWAIFQDPVEITNELPVFPSASIFFLGNIIFGIPTNLINQILFNFLLARSEPGIQTASEQESVPA